MAADARPPKWQYHKFRSFARGVDRELPADQLPDGVVWRADNIRFEGTKAKNAYGYQTYAEATSGKPQLVYTWENNTGTVETVLITTSSVFKKHSPRPGISWQMVKGPQNTTIKAANTVDKGDTSIQVTAITGFSTGDPISILMDDGTYFNTEVHASTAPTGTTITLAAGTPIPSPATTTNGSTASGQTAVVVNSTLGFNEDDSITIGGDAYTISGTEPTVSGFVLTGNTSQVYADGTAVVRTTNQSADALNTVVGGPVLTGDTSKPVSAITWPADNRMVFTNAATGEPVYWYNGTECVPIPDINGTYISLTAAQWITMQRNQIFLFGTTEGGASFPQRVRRCTVADGDDWNHVTAGTTAGYEDIFEDLGVGMRAEPLGASIALYFRDGIGMYDYVGQDGLLWKYRIPVRSQGLIGPGAIAPVKSFHVFVSDDDIFTFNGGPGLTPLGRSGITERTAVKNLFTGIDGDLNPAKKALVFGHYFEPTGEVAFVYPSAESDFPDKLWKFNLKSQGWSNKKFDQNTFLSMSSVDLGAGITWRNATGAWEDADYSWNSARNQASAPLTLMCSQDESQVYVNNYTGIQDDGKDVTWVLETGDVRVPDHSQLRVDFIDLVASGSNITVTYSTDEGVSYKALATASPGVTITSTRLHKQFVGQQVRFKLTGTTAVAIESLGLRFRPESVE